MKRIATFSILLFALLLLQSQTNAQGMLKGVVKDSNNEPLTGVSVYVAAQSAGTATDLDGSYSLQLPRGTHTVSFTYTGFAGQDVVVTIGSGDQMLDVIMQSGSIDLSEVVVTVGSRNTQRTVIDSPLPIDILSTRDLQNAGQSSFDKALQYRVPSFNTVNTPVNDATTLLDPWEIRNMGPSRTLILINGKRKNLSSLLYVQFSPGRGETGVDLSAIPQDAIKRVEILRDGASAQYGSDAMAGVMNIILKDRYDYSTLNIRSGVTIEGDGDMYGASFNSGSNLGGKGFVNYTIDLSQQNSAVRSGTIHVPTEIATFGNAFSAFTKLEDFQNTTGINYDETPINPNGANATQADMDNWNNNRLADNNSKYNTIISDYLKDFPTGGNINGSGDITAAKFLINAGMKIGDKGEIYTNGAYVVKRVLSFANFRVPYWRQDRGLLHSPTDNGGKNYISSASQLAFSSDGKDLYKGYTGYVPTFEGDLYDYNWTIGARNEIGDGWKTDLSLTTGANQQTYTVENTVNRTLGKASPTRFKPGGFRFSHVVGNLDISKAVTDEFVVSFGAEGRSEAFTIIAGDTASYSGEGANSFPGINSLNEGTNNRFNIGGYLDLAYDISDAFLINGTVRTEKYSDFGDATVYKVSSRYKFAEDRVVLRASYSTGFRAPSLHQIFNQSTQATFIGGFVQLAGLFNNRSAQARALGIPLLKSEKSTNLTVGGAFNPNRNLSFSVDYFKINIDDRIVFSSSISSSDPNSALYKILQDAGVVRISFFINGIETSTEGVDYVLSYRNIGLGSGKLGLNLAGNFILNNEIIGDPADPQAIKDAGGSILNAQIRSLLTESRPEYKAILGLDYGIGKWNFSLNNTLFGPVAFQDLDNGGSIMNSIRAVFKPKVVTDLSIGYNFTDKINLTLNANNLLNVLPEWDLEVISGSPDEDDATKLLADPDDKALLRGFLGFSGRYDILGYNGAHFSQLGTIFNANLGIRF